MNEYTLNARFSFSSRTFKRCIGHTMAQGVPGFLMVVEAGEKRTLLNLSKVKALDLDERFFLMMNAKVKQESQGKADFSDRVKA